MNKRVVIIGGGLAGIAAAVRLAEEDHQPIIIETRKRLGGRATSLVDPRSGDVIDNCQHVLMGCCTNLIDLYDRLGVLESIDWHRTLYWTAGRGEFDQVKAGLLPSPLHLSGSFRKMKLLGKKEKREIQRATWRMIRMGAKGRMAWSDRAFGDFLRECNQSNEVIAKFWSPIIVSACNLSVDRVSAACALQVFQEGFLSNRFSYTMGIPAVSLGELYEPVFDVIKQSGGEVRLGCSAKAIAYEGNRVTGVVTDDGVVEGAAVIASVPPDRLGKLVSEIMKKKDKRLQSLDQFEFSPILGVHLWFDQTIMDLPHLVVVNRGVQWLFNKGVDDEGRQHIHAVISAADEWMNLDEREIVERVVCDIHHALPNSVGLQPVQSRSIKEKRATFAVTPGIDSIRPSVVPGFVGVEGGGIKNLYLAGDWCATNWPATMESAVRSGYAAASAITGDDLVVDEIPSGLFARLLGLK